MSLRMLVAGGALAALVLVPSVSRAGAFLAADLDTGVARGSELPTPTLRIGSDYGVRGRIGYEIDGPLRLALEAGGGWTALPGGQVSAQEVVRGFVGLRLSLGSIISPVVYGHIGYGQIGRRGGRTAAELLSADERAPVFDVGAAGDFVALEVLQFGVHADYNVLRLQGGESVRWVAIGVHGSLGP